MEYNDLDNYEVNKEVVNEKLCYQALFIYKHVSKPELRLLYTGATCKNQREQRTFSYTKFGEYITLRKVYFTQLYINLTGQLPEHWKCRSNSCEVLGKNSAKIQKTCEQNTKFIDMLPYRFKPVDDYDNYTSENAKRNTYNRLSTDMSENTFNFLWSEHYEKQLDTVQQSYNNCCDTNYINNNDTKFQKQKKLLASIQTPQIVFAYHLIKKKPLIVVEGLIIAEYNTKVTHEITLDYTGKSKISYRPINMMASPITTNIFAVVNGIYIDQTNIILPPPPLFDAYAMYQKAFNLHVIENQNKLEKEYGQIYIKPNKVIQINTKKCRGRPKSYNVPSLGNFIQIESTINPHTYHPPIYGPHPF